MKSERAELESGQSRDAAAIPARTPRYVEIYRQLVSDIRDGRYPVGSKLPPELELCATFGASRHTVRDAVRRLTEQGLIARRAGAGTLVLRRTRSRGFTQQISAIPDLLAYVKSAQLEVLAARDIKASAQEAGLLRCRHGQAWHRLDALKHLRSARKPVAYVLAFVHRDHPALRGVLDRRGVALHDFIEERIGERIVTVEQELSAKPITGREAKALGVVPGLAGFVIARRYLSARGTAVLVTSTIFPYDRMRYSMSLKLA
ncbi:MAG: GntR family transcriptional regulator [Betaproteobacteria bacterium]